MIVTRLRQDQHLVVGGLSLAEALAIDTRLQLDDPNALAGRAPVLLDDAGLERHGLLEACGELGRVVERESVLEPDVHGRDLAEGVLRAHELHHVWGGPDLDASSAEAAHAVVELLLGATVGRDLPGVAAHDDEVEALAHIHELVVLLPDVVDQLAAHSSTDHAVGERDAVVAMAVAALVRAPVRLGAHVYLEQGALERGLLGLGLQPEVVLRDAGEARYVNGASRRERHRAKRARQT
mmetsp:Transcript_86238/g.244229  ORF Transcript_86238/g.244229 Transcript_86238/m.244229 type:complete len:238 (-) Transcript_86238:57-770(-)